MSNPLNHVPIGSKVVDCSALDFLVDLAPGARVGLCVTRDGFQKALMEIQARQAEFGDAAGIADATIADAVLVEERIAAIEAVLPAAEKIVEVLLETYALLDDERHRRILEIAAIVDRRSRRNPELLAQYEKTRAYRSALAQKAVATRRRNQANTVDADAGEPTIG
jgi:hypothetical protein